MKFFSHYLRCFSIVLCALFLYQTNLFSQRAWVTQPSGTTEDIYAMTMGYQHRVCGVGANGIIIGGQEYAAKSISQSGVSTKLYDICFGSWDLYNTNSSFGFVVGEGGAILKTTDVGVTWSKLQSNTIATLRGVSFVNPAKGFAVGDSGILLRTSDSGATWTKQFTGSTKNLNSISFFYDGLRGFIAGDSGTLFISTNAGETWNQNPVPSTVNLYDAKGFYDGAYTVGDSGTSLRSTDSGTTWEVMTTNVISILRRIITADESMYVVIAGDGGTILENFSTPNKWTKDYSGLTSTLCGGYAYGGGCTEPFVIIGSGGVMLRMDFGGAVRDQRTISANADYKLFQSYPNPFNPTTNISFQISSASNVILDLFSITGEKIVSLLNEHLQSGYYTQQINAESLHLASGTYLCRILAVDELTGKAFTQTQKIILMK